jgi:hypothetical protein
MPVIARANANKADADLSRARKLAAKQIISKQQPPQARRSHTPIFGRRARSRRRWKCQHG